MTDQQLAGIKARNLDGLSKPENYSTFEYLLLKEASALLAEIERLRATQLDFNLPPQGFVIERNSYKSDDLDDVKEEWSLAWSDGRAGAGGWSVNEDLEYQKSEDECLRACWSRTPHADAYKAWEASQEKRDV